MPFHNRLGKLAQKAQRMLLVDERPFKRLFKGDVSPRNLFDVAFETGSTALLVGGTVASFGSATAPLAAGRAALRTTFKLGAREAGRVAARELGRVASRETERVAAKYGPRVLARAAARRVSKEVAEKGAARAALGAAFKTAGLPFVVPGKVVGGGLRASKGAVTLGVRFARTHPRAVASETVRLSARGIVQKQRGARYENQTIAEFARQRLGFPSSLQEALVRTGVVSSPEAARSLIEKEFLSPKDPFVRQQVFALRGEQKRAEAEARKLAFDPTKFIQEFAPEQNLSFEERRRLAIQRGQELNRAIKQLQQQFGIGRREAGFLLIQAGKQIQRREKEEQAAQLGVPTPPTPTPTATPAPFKSSSTTFRIDSTLRRYMR